MKDNCIGLLAYSKCGRDKKRLFCVIGVLDEDFVLIADGRLRRMEKPKKKTAEAFVLYGCGTACASAQ